MGFHFIDQITAIDGERAVARLRRPATVPPLPVWLVIEAVGQLAGWIAMLRGDFGRRPVAALVGEIRISEQEADSDVTLEAQIERQDARAILYAGSARCGEREIVALGHCVGPLLPMEAFDDPAAVRARFDSLRGGTPAAQPAVDADAIVRPDLSPIAVRDGTASSQLQVPAAAFFADHFPLRPVFPASLLADAMRQLGAAAVADEGGIAPDRLRVQRLSDYKVRAFSPPGQLLEMSAESRAARGEPMTADVHASAGGKRIARGVLVYRTVPAA